MSWNFDIASAPRGREVTTTVTADGKERTKREYHVDPVWLATADGKVHRSYWIRATKTTAARWSGFNPDSPAPIAWQPFVVPAHPNDVSDLGLGIVHRHEEINLPIIEDVGSGA